MKNGTCPMCASCGHIELGVADSHKARIVDLVKSDKWKKLGNTNTGK